MINGSTHSTWVTVGTYSNIFEVVVDHTVLFNPLLFWCTCWVLVSKSAANCKQNYKKSLEGVCKGF